MTTFLHISDIHLGIKRYGIPERTLDFFNAFYDVIQEAIRRKVDFVLVGGDLFDKRQIDSEAAQHAITGFRALQEARIPVFAIEGNHDQCESGSDNSWMRTLSRLGYFDLLEPQYDREEMGERFCAWDPKSRKGWYADIGEVRIFGSKWYGASVAGALPELCSALESNQRPGAFRILMLHTEVEGQLSKLIPSLALSKLRSLQDLTDYVALGHIHKNFVIDNWAYNPGSLEACSADESTEVRGAYFVDIDPLDGRAYPILFTGYRQRPFVRVRLDLSEYLTAEDANRGILQFILSGMRSRVSRWQNPDGSLSSFPIVDAVLTGTVAFPGTGLTLDKIQEDIISITGALCVLFHNETVAKEFAIAAQISKVMNRRDREVAVIEELVGLSGKYEPQKASLGSLILQVKGQLLEKEAPEKIFDLLESFITKTK